MVTALAGKEAGPRQRARLPALSAEAHHRTPVGRLCCRLRPRTRRTDVLLAVQRVRRHPESGVDRRPLVRDPVAGERFSAWATAEREHLVVVARPRRGSRRRSCRARPRDWHSMDRRRPSAPERRQRPQRRWRSRVRESWAKPNGYATRRQAVSRGGYSGESSTLTAMPYGRNLTLRVGSVLVLLARNASSSLG